MAEIVSHEGIAFKIKKGESFTYSFSVKDTDGTAQLVHTNWTESMEQYYNGSTVTAFAVSSIGGSPEKIVLELTPTNSAAAEEGWYNGVIYIADADNKHDVMNFSMELTATATAEVPISTDVIIEDLEIATTFSRTRINRAIARAQDRTMYLIPQSVRVWCIENSWPRNISSWATQLAELYLQQKIYPGRDDEFNTEINIIEKMLENVQVDADQDGIIDPGEPFGGSSFNLRRFGT